MYVCVYTHHILFIHSFVDGHLAYFHLLGTLTTSVFVSQLLILLCIYLEVKLLDHTIMLS